MCSSLRSVKEFTESFSPNREEFTFYPLGSLPGYYHFALNRSCWVDDLYPLKRTWNFIQKSFIFQREALRGEIRPSCHSRQECRMFVSGGNFSMNTNFVVTVSLKVKILSENPAVWNFGQISCLEVRQIHSSVNYVQFVSPVKIDSFWSPILSCSRSEPYPLYNHFPHFGETTV